MVLLLWRSRRDPLRALGYWEISKVKPPKKRVSLGTLSKTLLLMQKEVDGADILLPDFLEFTSLLKLSWGCFLQIKILMTNDRMNVGVQPTNPAQLSLSFQLSRKDLQPPRLWAFALFIFVTSVCIWKHIDHVGSPAIRGNMVIHTVPQSWGSDITLKTLNSQNLQTSCRFMCASATKFDIKYFSRFMWFSTIIIIVNITLRDRQCLNVLSLFSLFLKIWFKNSAIFLFVEKNICAAMNQWTKGGCCILLSSADVSYSTEVKVITGGTPTNTHIWSNTQVCVCVFAIKRWIHSRVNTHTLLDEGRSHMTDTTIHSHTHTPVLWVCF